MLIAVIAVGRWVPAPLACAQRTRILSSDPRVVHPLDGRLRQACGYGLVVRHKGPSAQQSGITQQVMLPTTC
jgi:hypothetical protein